MNIIEEKHYYAFDAELDKGKAQATITKETAVGFDRWKFKNQCKLLTDNSEGILFYRHNGKVLDDSELYDLYVESLKQTT